MGTKALGGPRGRGARSSQGRVRERVLERFTLAAECSCARMVVQYCRVCVRECPRGHPSRADGLVPLAWHEHVQREAIPTACVRPALVQPVEHQPADAVDEVDNVSGARGQRQEADADQPFLQAPWRGAEDAGVLLRGEAERLLRGRPQAPERRQPPKRAQLVMAKLVAHARLVGVASRRRASARAASLRRRRDVHRRRRGPRAAIRPCWPNGWRYCLKAACGSPSKWCATPLVGSARRPSRLHPCAALLVRRQLCTSRPRRLA